MCHPPLLGQLQLNLDYDLPRNEFHRNRLLGAVQVLNERVTVLPPHQSSDHKGVAYVDFDVGPVGGAPFNTFFVEFDFI